MSKWRPIETCPLCLKAPYETVLFYLPEVHGWSNITTGFCTAGYHGLEYTDGEFYFEPTHWMPLPEPPA